MIFLGLTASTDRGGLVLFKDQKIIYEKSWTRETQQSEALTFFLDKGLRKNKLTVKDITTLALDIGPGSFTGCRIAANISKTIAQELNLPVFTVSSLDILLFQSEESKKLTGSPWPLIDAQKSLFYSKEGSQIKLYSREEVLEKANGSMEIFGVLPEDFKKALKMKKVKFPSRNKAHFPQPSTLGHMFFRNPQLFSEQSWMEVEPLYIRAPDAVEKLRIKN